MKRLTLLFLFALMVISGCTNYKSVNVESVNLSGFRMENSTKATISFNLKVDNPLHTSITLESFDGILRKDYERFATFSLDEPTTIAPDTEAVVAVTMVVSLCDPMSLLSMGLNIKSWKADAFTVDGKIVLKNGSGVKRAMKVKDIQLNKMIKTFKSK